MCLFSVHDLVKDPPFSRMDLVCLPQPADLLSSRSCSSGSSTTFHYALRPGRHLFLGPSEGVASQAHLFAPLDKRHRALRPARRGGELSQRSRCRARRRPHVRRPTAPRPH